MYYRKFRAALPVLCGWHQPNAGAATYALRRSSKGSEPTCGGAAKNPVPNPVWFIPLFWHEQCASAVNDLGPPLRDRRSTGRGAHTDRQLGLAAVGLCAGHEWPLAWPLRRMPRDWATGGDAQLSASARLRTSIGFWDIARPLRILATGINAAIWCHQSRAPFDVYLQESSRYVNPFTATGPSIAHAGITLECSMNAAGGRRSPEVVAGYGALSSACDAGVFRFDGQARRLKQDGHMSTANRFTGARS